MINEEKKYNGWTNYETWVVNLWIDNDKGDYDYWREKTELILTDKLKPDTKTDAVYHLSNMLKDYFLENNPLPDAGVYTDLLNSALSEVCWYEIAEALVATHGKGVSC